MSSEDKDLSVLCIGVLTGEGNIIHDSYTLVARNNKFKIWISEEEGAWTSDCSQALKEMEEDPFDLDYLLGLGQNLKDGGGMSSTSVEVHEASGEKGIDLNVRADLESQIDGEADQTGQNEGSGSESEGSGLNLGEPQTKKWRRMYSQ
ncbi:hypothetical protein L1987_71318 [Smallanthus sonchifolius]|uniref:Uncharacterized protein n=1 Tax=Smallanthus sonchifolius TaxID=185202 RepID=A0ACB9ASF3_9ASTR|nr:hypothetical protein L1987_71318 [Smallanthus sonchifolius]